ncbi:MAG TPA: DUF3052 domain-containing protein [Terriglobales bacterium]
MAGYSGKPLAQKIGIKAGHRVVFRNHPASFVRDLGKLPEGVTKSDRLRGKADVVVFFAHKLASLESDLSALVRTMESNGMLWIAWPKRASGLPTDLTEDVVRGVALGRGLVDVKVCAIDDTWSGLKLVIRLKDRPAKSQAVRGRSIAGKQKEK